MHKLKVLPFSNANAFVAAAATSAGRQCSPTVKFFDNLELLTNHEKALKLQLIRCIFFLEIAV